MEKQRKWQFLLILTVIVLTVYNILPTVFYYLKPLKEPVNPAAAANIGARIADRVDSIEKETRDWIRSYCELLHAKPTSISSDHPQLVTVTFGTREDARRFRAFLPRAGSLIPFAPAQLTLVPQEEENKEVLVQRRIPVRLDRGDFSYLPKNDPRFLDDRMERLSHALTGPSDASLILNALEKGNIPFQVIETLAAEINALDETFDADTPLCRRFVSRFGMGETTVQRLIQAFDAARDAIRQDKNRSLLEKKEASLLAAENYVKKHASRFAASQATVHPLFASPELDPAKDQIVLRFHPDVLEFLASGKNRERFEQLVIDELARIARVSFEELSRGAEAVSIPLHRLPQVSGYLALDQQKLARRASQELQASIRSQWLPRHPDLAELSIVDYATYLALPQEQKALCLVVASPLTSDLSAFKPHSLFVAAKGIDRIAKSYEQFPGSQLALDFQSDFRRLADILQRDGFIGYPGSSLSAALAGEGDVLFEKPNFLATLLASTREDFIVRGSGKLAVLELGDVEQRILVENKIETQIHEDLLKWKDDYRAAQVSLDPNIRYDVPKPVKGTFWSNVLLSARKYIRGDERKIIRWGLDLSGGKSVQIELRDVNRKPVTEDADLKQGINELYNRVNKMGVSEVSIRQVGHQIVLDFPGSQAMSASELIKASTMVFHLVNEAFSPSNPALGGSVNRFLQEVWNEASVTNKKDPQSVNAIAYRHLHTENGAFRSEAASELWERGLRLAPPNDSETSHAVDDSVSKIAIFRGDDFTEWQNQTHPLLIVFLNSVLEGSSLQNIHPGYDPGKGNFLSFDVSSSYDLGGKRVEPRKDLYAWTSRYSKEKVTGTPLENETRGRGWRMAVLLNDQIISSPTLDSALRDSAMISGSFSQREVNRLAADLKAGSLTFTPQILSEKNVSPELGQADRLKGITATIIAFLLVIGSMVTYYRFAGLVASVAVFFNLLILWATLQNLGATLTLAGLAAVVLTIGMAVDANVLVFERIKEEFAESGSIRSALSAGYRKAYSAIIDSNVTTIIAALILLNFDAGPIKSFAINLIIGIASSMFTALFVTRFYFTGWAQNPKHAALKMANWIRSTQFDFLKRAKLSFGVAAAIILIGCSLIFTQRSSIFGMDFTGGYSLNIELENAGQSHYAPAVEKALHAAGAAASDFQVRELNPTHHLRLLFGTTMELPGKPFRGMPVEKEPRIAWILDALHKEGLTLAKSQKEFNWTAMSGQMSDSMRNNALIGLALSFLAIFVYLAFRFEYKFAAAALICLFHDVFITLGFVGLVHVIGLPVQIDLNTIAALMTIIGYSLNDTIIIFDRIREEMHGHPNKRLPDLVNHALNATLSRTTITSGTTLLVLIALVLFGGPSLFSFSLVMTVGIFFGTLSSWFIASPLMIFFHKKEEKAISVPL